MPVLMQQRDKISIVQVGEDPMDRALQKALAEQMDQAGIEEIELAQELEPVYLNTVLVVKLYKPGLIWTAFLATSQFSIK